MAEPADSNLPNSFSKIVGGLAGASGLSLEATDITADLARCAISWIEAPEFFGRMAGIGTASATLRSAAAGAAGSSEATCCRGAGCGAAATDCGAAAPKRSSNENDGGAKRSLKEALSAGGGSTITGLWAGAVS